MTSDEDWDLAVIAAAAGDQIAMSRLLVRAHREMLPYVRQRVPLDLGRVVGPEDILQEVFIAAFEQIATLRNRTASGFSAWLKTITENHILNAAASHATKKRGGNCKRVDLNGDSTTAGLLEFLIQNGKSPRSIAGNREYVHLVEAALSELPSEQRRVLRMRFVEDVPHAAIAHATGRTAVAVRQICLRALKQLRALLQSK